ncbi:MAG: hypothetical protein RIQ81_1348 [Pseudomonadota bacterium]|jgi:hypothetical protein
MKVTSGTKSLLAMALASQLFAAGCRIKDVATESSRAAGNGKSSRSSDKGSTFMGDGTGVKEDQGGKDVAEVSEKTEVPECALLDPNGNVSQVIPGGPAGLVIPVSKYVKQPGLVSYSSPSEAKFKFDVFRGPNGLVLEWPSGVGGHSLYVYEATIASADTAKCTITAKLVDSVENRTMLGCFDPATRIRMASGRDVRIDAVKPGDMVFNPIVGKSVPVVRVTKGPEAGKGMYLIGFKGQGNEQVKVTSKHPFMTDQGLRAAEQLRKGDRILTADGSFRKIEVAKSLPEKAGQVVVNVSLAGAHLEASHHMVLANGVVSGDLQLQERLENVTQLSLSRAKVAK